MVPVFRHNSKGPFLLILDGLCKCVLHGYSILSCLVFPISTNSQVPGCGGAISEHNMHFFSLQRHCVIRTLVMGLQKILGDFEYENLIQTCDSGVSEQLLRHPSILGLELDRLF